jgi:hypothetical protein
MKGAIMKQETITELNKQVEELTKQILNEKINASNIDNLGKIVDIYKDIKEVECMNYSGNYGNSYGRPGHGSYGEYNRGYGEYNDGYNARGRDSKYRGYGHLDRMYNEYGNYSYGRERYGANEDTKKSLEYMLRSMEDFARMLKEEAQSQEEVMMIKQTAQRIAQM